MQRSKTNKLQRLFNANANGQNTALEGVKRTNGVRPD
jgi:hypothetical protein